MAQSGEESAAFRIAMGPSGEAGVSTIDKPVWTEPGEVQHLVVPARSGGHSDGQDDVIVVGLDVLENEAGVVVVRDSRTGEHLGEAQVPWIADIKAAWNHGELLIAVATDSPRSLVVFSWDEDDSLQELLEVPGVHADSVALCVSDDGVALAYMSGGICHVIDPETGTPR